VGDYRCATWKLTVDDDIVVVYSVRTAAVVGNDYQVYFSHPDAEFTKIGGEVDKLVGAPSSGGVFPAPG